ncbi:MAG: hypothetical protein S4CHLAM102_05720 [Chlamydiia bacterium]|nr:hypothetical protein [Chlamydiia bacterium]
MALINGNSLIQQATEWMHDVDAPLRQAMDLAQAPDVDGAAPQYVRLSHDWERFGHNQPRLVGLCLMNTIENFALGNLAIIGGLWDCVRFVTGDCEWSELTEALTEDVKNAGALGYQGVIATLELGKELLNSLCTATGLMVWYGGEWVVNQITGDTFSVLSNNPILRDKIFCGIGETLLAAGALMIPVAAIQLFALPIIAHAIFDTVHYVLNMRECPEFNICKLEYEGANTGNRLFQTNDLMMAPVAGCYLASGSRVHEIALSLLGTLSYTATTLPVPVATGMFAVVGIVGLVAGEIFAQRQKSSVEEGLQDYAAHVGFDWTEARWDMTWTELQEDIRPLVEEKSDPLTQLPEAVEAFKTELGRLGSKITGNSFSRTVITDYCGPLPMRYFVGWHTNLMRAWIASPIHGVVPLIATVALRLF